MTALFLDRDGVINEEKDGSYIFHKDEFVFYPGAVEALVHLTRKFDYVFIVTNQRGVGRGYMTEAALLEIHDHLTEAVVSAGGHITRIYFAPFVDSNHPHRKPNTGMALDAQRDFPDIDFHKSVMVGNNLSDMQFGKTMGMKTVFLYTTQAQIPLPHPLIDEQYSSLQSWSEQLSQSS
jgi:D-glycero-D-manno-heptose 1,7-bisphosphate phosphatase